MASHPTKQKVAGGGGRLGLGWWGGSKQKEKGLMDEDIGVVIVGGRGCKGDKW